MSIHFDTYCSPKSSTTRNRRYRRRALKSPYIHKSSRFYRNAECRILLKAVIGNRGHGGKRFETVRVT